MSIVTLLIVLVIVGVALWALETLIPMDATIRRLISVVIVIVVLVWLLRYVGVAL